MSPEAWLLLAWLGVGSVQTAAGFLEEGDRGAVTKGLGSSQVFFLDLRDDPEGPCFVGKARGMRVGLLPGALLVECVSQEASEGVLVRLSFEDASSTAELEPLDPRPGLYHFFLGDDPAKWRRNIRAHGAVLCRGLYPGIDLLLRGEGEELEYDLLVAPGADLSQVAVRCEGMESMEITPGEGVVLETALGKLHHPLGHCWQETEEGTREEVEVAYRWIDDERFGFDAPGRDPSLFLTIDPRLVWSTYLGGIGGGPSVGDIARSVALDPQGNVTVIGTSEGGELGGGFPMTPGTFQSPGGQFLEDVFVTRFRADGTLVYSSMIGGGSHEDRGQDVAVDSLGRATVVGWTNSPDFPTTPGSWDPVKTGTNSGFVFRLSALGEDLQYSTFLEGTLGSEALTVAVAASGSAIVGGETSSADFPTTPGAFDTTFGGLGSDGFVTRLDPSGSFLEWSTFLGGFGPDEVFALAIDGQENVTATGLAGSADFPTTPGAFKTGIPYGGDAFVARIDSTGSSLLWSTLLGGDQEDRGFAVGLTLDGGVVIGGDTRSFDFPTTPGAFQTTHAPGPVNPWDTFVTRMDPTGSRLVYSTFLGGDEGDFLDDIVVDASGVATAVGSTSSVNFPLTPGAFDTDPTGKNDAITVSRLDPLGSRLFYSSIVGGSQADTGEGITMNPSRRVTLVGRTFSCDYPTTPDAFQPTPPGGNTDAVITTMDLLLQGVQQLGKSTPSCLGPLDLNATEMPVAGASTFGVYCSAAPPLARGFLIVSMAGSSSALRQTGSGRLGMPPTMVQLVESNAEGFAETRLPLPAGVTGMQLICRYVFRNTSSCTGPLPWSATNGLLITVQ